MKLLFVCNQNLHRSRTAEDLLKGKYETASAGLYGGTLLSPLMLSNSDIVFVMDSEQRSEIAKRFPSEYLKSKIISLDVPDHFSYGQPELISLLKSKLSTILEIEP